MELKVLVTYTNKPGHGRSFLEDVVGGGLRSAVLAEEGCLQYDYYVNAAQPDQVLLVEHWSSREAQRLHAKQPHMDILRRAKEAHVVDTKLEFFDI